LASDHFSDNATISGSDPQTEEFRRQFYESGVDTSTCRLVEVSRTEADFPVPISVDGVSREESLESLETFQPSSDARFLDSC
jgi:hypothetical protein